MKLVTKRPQRKGALNTSDLTLRRRVRMHFKGGHVDLEILSGPREPRPAEARLGRVITVRNLRDGEQEVRFLGDLGVEPYPNGQWSAEQWTTAL